MRLNRCAPPRVSALFTAAYFGTAPVGRIAFASPAPEKTAPLPACGPFIAAANPFHVHAGLCVLKRGGSAVDAVDAAVTIREVLGLVERQSSGLGGGPFMKVSGGGHCRGGEYGDPVVMSPLIILDQQGDLAGAGVCPRLIEPDR